MLIDFLEMFGIIRKTNNQVGENISSLLYGAFVDRIVNLKSIIHSKRANLYFLEKCRVMVKDGRVVYLSEKSKQLNYWNIPIANTTVIILGLGTSITNSAVRMLASAGVLIGFSGDDCTPLFAGAEIEWISPVSEYRPTEYCQGWVKKWQDENTRLKLAKDFQKSRIDFIKKVWGKDKMFCENGINIKQDNFSSILYEFERKIDDAPNVTKLLQLEATMTKSIYKEVSTLIGIFDFVRDRESMDYTNRFLNHGNYLAYGLAASVLWCLGIPHSFAVMHGKTRRGALVFDVADLIKDAIVLPLSFILGKDGVSDVEFRKNCISFFIEYKAMDYMFNVVKNFSEENCDDSDISV